MVLTDEKNELIDIQDIRAELNEFTKNGESIPSIEELENDLQNYYNQALDLESERYGFSVQRDFMGGVGKKILGKVQKVVCEKVDNTTNPSDLVDIVLDVVSSIIPGGLILKPIVKKLVKFIVGQGVTKFCAIPLG